MRDDGPRRALERRIDGRRAGHDLPADVARAAELAEREQLLGGVGLHGRGLRVRRVAFCEPQAAVDAATVPLGALVAAQLGFVLRIREQRRIAGFAAAVVERISVSRALVFERRVAEVAALEQHFGEQEVGLCGLRVIRERLQVRAVPARGGRVLARFLRLLRLGVMVGGQVRHVALQVRDDLGLLLEREPLPVRAARAVGLDEILLALEHQIGELAFLERLDDLDLQQRRLRVIRVELDERVVSVGSVLKALLVEIEIAEVRVGDEPVRPRAVPAEIARDRLGAVQIREADRQYAERVVDDLLLRTAHRRVQHGGIAVAARVVVGPQLPVQQREERRQALFVELLLEHGPAVLVQGLLVEWRAIAFLEHDRVGALRVAIALLHEQRLAAPELRFVELLRARVLLDQAIERRQRVVDAPFGFVSSRELVENEIVLGVVRIRLEQLLVHLESCCRANRATRRCSQAPRRRPSRAAGPQAAASPRL